VVAHLLVNIARGLARRELRVGLPLSTFWLGLLHRACAYPSVGRNGTRVDSDETTPTRSPIALAVRIVVGLERVATLQYCNLPGGTAV